jgi:hypothetical protein
MAAFLGPLFRPQQTLSLDHAIRTASQGIPSFAGRSSPPNEARLKMPCINVHSRSAGKRRHPGACSSRGIEGVGNDILAMCRVGRPGSSLRGRGVPPSMSDRLARFNDPTHLTLSKARGRDQVEARGARASSRPRGSSHRCRPVQRHAPQMSEFDVSPASTSVIATST